MSEIINVGNASQIQDDDVARDVNLQRSPRLVHKVPQGIKRDSSILYGGHVIMLYEAAVVMPSYSFNHTNTETQYIGNGTKQNTDISSLIPKDLKKTARAMIAKVSLRIQSDTVKTGSATVLAAAVRYNILYDTYTGTAASSVLHMSVQAPIDAAVLYLLHEVQVIMPIVWKGNVPYICWYVRYDFTDMTSDSGTYQLSAHGYVQGFIA